MTADGHPVADTMGRVRHKKHLYIFRAKRQGNCPESVGRWGLLKQAQGAFADRKP